MKYFYLKLHSLKVRLLFIRKYILLGKSLKKTISISIGRASPRLHFLETINPSNPEMVLNIIDNSNSQIFQDIFVLNELKFLRNGFYVEFGALNGVKHSNTFLLEQNYNWNGILVEPSLRFFPDLKKNRSKNSLDNRAVYSVSGDQLLFNETNVEGLATLDTYSSSGGWERVSDEKYLVETITLLDLLIEKNAPKTINYLSIDTEGSEFEILKHFDFDVFFIEVITVEHNFTKSREDIFKLLTSKGFKRKYDKFSSYDDWYINDNIC